MNSETLQHLKDEILQEIRENLKNSKLDDLCQKYDLYGDKVLKLQFILDLTKVQFSDAADNLQPKEFVILDLCLRPGCPPGGCPC